VEDLLALARSSLAWAEAAERSDVRFGHALTSAKRSAAALLASGRPGTTAEVDADIWLATTRRAPELAEWAAYFAAAAAKARGAGLEQYLISAREADDLVRDARAFLVLVSARLRRRGLASGVG
jgi:hypothetical protein